VENRGLWKLTPLMEIRSRRGFPQRLGKHKTLSTVPTRPDGGSTDLIHQQGGAKSNDQKGPNQVDGSKDPSSGLTQAVSPVGWPQGNPRFGTNVTIEVGCEVLGHFLTADEVKNLSAATGVAYKKLEAIFPSLAAPNVAPNIRMMRTELCTHSRNPCRRGRERTKYTLQLCCEMAQLQGND
jgi:hypothetical protein